MENKDYLYIFIHIPKTGGTTIKENIKANLGKDEFISLYWDEKPSDLRLISEETIKKLYPLKEEILAKISIELSSKKNIFNSKEEAKKYITSLSEKEKEKIKVIIGHHMPYGIHKYFNKKPRYITFLRNPIDRRISEYNYKRSILEKNTDILKNKIPKLKELNINIIDFEESFKKYPSMNNLMTKVLSSNFK